LLKFGKLLDRALDFMIGNKRSFLIFSLFFLVCNSTDNLTYAQIIPDDTLGNENSRVTPVDPQLELIEGGAIRGTNLFHSFQEFNISEGSAAYFANPEAIQNIFSRVTGVNPSLLFGKLGVLGNANLFFINPNGIIFGSNASLDLNGSFVGSTANSFIFPNGEMFSAIDPNAPPLLTIDAPSVGLQFESLEAKGITNHGNLGTEQNLALVGGTIVNTGQLFAPNGEISLFTVDSGNIQLDGNGKFLDILTTGQLTQRSEVLQFGEISIVTGDIFVLGSSNIPSLQSQQVNLSAANNLILLNSAIAASEDVNLLARDTVLIRDSTDNPFIVLAGENLTIKGEKSVDIFALNHPTSELISGKETILRSPDTVIGDARFWSGESFEIQKLDGSLGNLSSPKDPIIRSQGDVSIGYYQGASLHILAGGEVNIGTVVITNPDTVGEAINPFTTPTLANISLSNGTPLTIDGTTQATLDIRAGMNIEAIGEPLGTIGSNSGIFLNPLLAPFIPSNNPIATSADIEIGQVKIFPPDGLIFLTNQYESNRSLSGGNITVTGVGFLEVLDISTVRGIDATGIGGKGSDVIIDARTNIDIQGDINATSQVGGANLVFNAVGDITIEDSIINVRGSDRGSIKINANNLFVNGEITRIRAGIESNLGASTSQAGDIDIKVTDEISINGGAISNVVNTNGTGNAGDINILSSSLTVTGGGGITASTFGKGNGGTVNIRATEGITITGENSLFNSSISSRVNNTAEGNSGGVVIETGFLSLENGGQIDTSVFGTGNGGIIQIEATEGISITGEDSRRLGSGIYSQLSPTETSIGRGNSGGIFIETNSLSLDDGGTIGTSNIGSIGNTGLIQINVAESISITGEDSRGLDSGIYSRIVSTETSIARGNSGGIFIETGSLLLKNGGTIGADTSGIGNTGRIEISATEGISFVGTNSLGFGSGIYNQVSSEAEGNSGEIVINTTFLSLENGGIITANTFSKGNAGTIRINATDNISLTGTSSTGSSSIVSQVGNNAEGFSGGIIIDTNTLSLTDGAAIDASTFGKGNSGVIKINATENISISGNNSQLEYSSRIVSDVIDTGNGDSGGIIINTNTLNITNGGLISADTAGTGNAGAIKINATESISISGTSNLGSLFITSSVLDGGKGNSGGIVIDTKTLSVTDGGTINANTSNQGDAGEIKINASENVSISSTSSLGLASSINSAILEGGDGNSGGIVIDANTLSVTGGGQINASTNDNGDAGTIQIDATDSVFISGESSQGLSLGLASSIEPIWDLFRRQQVA
jgi:filamentous hemagglutinin family protein